MTTLARHLHLALTSEDLAASRAHLLSAWTRSPCERIARIIQCVDEKLGIPVAFGTIEGALAALEDHDPRMAQVALALLAEPPFRDRDAVHLYKRACEQIVASRDARAVAKLEAIVQIYPAVMIGGGERVAAMIATALVELRDAIRQIEPMLPSESGTCVALEKRFGVRRMAADAETTAELLAAIYEAPHDDGPRLALADHLQTLGDPRGEFIALQLARAGGRTDDTTRARELELIREHKWAGAVARAAPYHAYHRGFVAYARVQDMPLAVAKDSAWGTVEVFDSWAGLSPLDRDELHGVVERCRGARALINLQPSFFAKLSDERLAAIERIEGIVLQTQGDVSAITRWLRDARRPRILGFTGGDGQLSLREILPIVESEHFARLETLVVHAETVAPWAERFADTLRLVVRLEDGTTVDIAGRHVTIRREARRAGILYQSSIQAIQKSLGRDVVITLDARTAWFPGLTVAFDQPQGTPVLQGIADDLDLLGR